MPLATTGLALLGATAAILVAGPALAEGPPGYRPGFHAPARPLPPEVRYRDPRYRPIPPRAPRLGPPVDLIQAYLPRYTETPMYNEPPSRFPRR